MICANRPLHRSKGDGRRGFDPFAGCQGRGGCGLRGGGGSEFLRYHAPALGISRRAASGYPAQTQGNHTLSVKAELPRLDPNSKGGLHIASPTS